MTTPIAPTGGEIERALERALDPGEDMPLNDPWPFTVLHDAYVISRADAHTLAAALRAEKAKSEGLERGDLIERVAQWLHDEAGVLDPMSDRTWPDCDRDEGRREGGFVKLVPASIVAEYRDVAKRLLTQLPGAATAADKAFSAEMIYELGTRAETAEAALSSALARIAEMAGEK